MRENESRVQRFGTTMLAAIDTGTISDFVKDNPAAAYGIAGAVILILVLLLISRRRRGREEEGGDEKQSVKADAKPADEAEPEKDESEKDESEKRAETPRPRRPLQMRRPMHPTPRSRRSRTPTQMPTPGKS